MFTLENLTYAYEKGNNVLKGVNYSFEKGKVYSIVGNSGAGKSTILLLLAGLDSPQEGRIVIDGVDIKEKSYDYHRKKNVSLIFQQYNLIQYMTALENIRLVDPKAPKELLLQLHLGEEEIHRKVSALSGGQQQRVAIARALASQTDIILADEPTGNLDEDTANEIMDIFLELAHEKGKCVILVTHSKAIAKRSDCILQLSGKTIVENKK